MKKVILISSFALISFVLDWVITFLISLTYNYILKRKLPNIIFKSCYLMALPILLLFFSCGKISCKEHQKAYQDGFSMGEIAKSLGDYSGANEILYGLNKRGIYPHVMNNNDKDCFCIGYNDAFKGNKSEYPEKEN